MVSCSASAVASEARGGNTARHTRPSKLELKSDALTCKNKENVGFGVCFLLGAAVGCMLNVGVRGSTAVL